jgi:cation diffusion facilitator CzcD-associated flavoprotein CzcO
MMDGATAEHGLAALERRLRRELTLLELPAKPWVPARNLEGCPVTDVAVIGGGMSGLAAAGALRLLGIERVVVVDRAADGQEGPWVTYARMRTLRSPKDQAGPALDIPSLTFRAWFEAQFGVDAWAALDRIPRPMWMDYLIWYRRVLAVDVRNRTDVTLIRPREDGLLVLELAEGSPLVARRVVLATGRDGLGGPAVPAFLADLPRRFWAHSADSLDAAGLAGKRVAVIGAGASAFDNAAVALDAGCARLDMFVRRPDVPRVDRFTGFAGMIHGFEALPDAWKWRMLHLQLVTQTPPPRHSVLRVAGFPQARLHTGCPIRRARPVDDGVVLETPAGEFAVDFLICGTGFRVDLSQRPELALIGPAIRFWGDRFRPSPDEANQELAESPDLDANFAFQERTPGACPALSRIHCFNYAATLSHGKLSGDIRAISQGAQRLARGIARSLFVEDAELHFAALRDFDEAELRGDEWPGFIHPVGGEAS